MGLTYSILEAFYVQGSARAMYCTCFYLMDHGGKIMDSVMRKSNRFFELTSILMFR